MRTSRASRAPLVVVAATLCACSILAPGDDEYLGGSGTSSGGVAGASTGGAGAGGSATGGTNAGGTSAGGTAGAPSGGGTGAVGGAGGAGAAGGAGGTGGTGAAGGAGGTGGTGAAGATGGTGGTGAVGGSGGTGGATCVAGTAPATPESVALYVLLDRTSSVINGGPWPLVEQGIGAYVDSTQSSGTSIGLNAWPSSGSCTGTGYDTPSLAIGLLPGNASAVKSWLTNPPGGGAANPMDGVLIGGVAACKSYMGANPKKQCKLVLVSDYGTTSTNTCSSSVGALANILSTARVSLPSVITQVIRLPTASGSPLDQFAQAGSLNGAINVNASSDVSSALALFQRPCQYELPANATGGTVTWKRGTTVLSEVSGPAACNTELQYYLTADAMVLCPDGCAASNGLSQTINSTVTCN